MSGKIIGNGLLILALLGVATFIYKTATSPKIVEGEILTREGLHWHAHLSIKIDGREIEIPTDIGIETMGHPENMHTHAADGIIHLERAGIVTTEDAKLKHFFTTWEKDFSKDSILDCGTVQGKTVRMSVNGENSSDFGEYVIKNQGNYSLGQEQIDNIEITCE